MSELMIDYIGEDEDKRRLIDDLVEDLRSNGMDDEKIKLVVDNFIKNHGDEFFIRSDYNSNEEKKVR